MPRCSTATASLLTTNSRYQYYFGTEQRNVDDDDDNQPTLVFQAGILHLHDPILIQKFSYLDRH